MTNQNSQGPKPSLQIRIQDDNGYWWIYTPATDHLIVEGDDTENGGYIVYSYYHALQVLKDDGYIDNPVYMPIT